MGESEKSIRLVTALVECRPDGEYAPWGIKWYDGKIYPFNRIESYSPRSWALGPKHQSESWRVVMGDAPVETSAITKIAGMLSTTPTTTPPRQAPRRPCK